MQIRPMLPIALIFNDKPLLSNALLDTGADVNVLPYTMGIQLGASWENARRAEGLSGNLGQAETRAILLKGVMAPFEPVELAFAWVKTEQVRLILGQTNFSQLFDVCFFRQQQAFEITLR
jgi:hypothetical protein